MKMEVEIISKEMIKPSSPTPPHLRNFKLSLHDQLAPPVYFTLLFFYPNNNNNEQFITSLLLKQSLSQTLTTFYPLAGTPLDAWSIDCNDSGAEFVEARVRHTPLSDVLRDPLMADLRKLEPLAAPDAAVVLSAKLNHFDCGGVTLGVSVSHRVADGSSLVAFVSAWAAACRGDKGTAPPPPAFDLASRFPPTHDDTLLAQTRVTLVGTGDVVTKRFVFGHQKIVELKKTSSSSLSSSSTRVEAVTAYMFRLFMELAPKTSSAPLFAAIHVVNMRPRNSSGDALSSLSSSFGNCWRGALVVGRGDAVDDDCAHLATKFRTSIRSIDKDEFIKNVEEGEFLAERARMVGVYSTEGIGFLNFSSWCGFPVYEVDFGRGKPEWVCTTTLPMKNLVIFIDTQCGRGIEAWVNMLHHDMNVFEHHLNNFLHH